MPDVAHELRARPRRSTMGGRGISEADTEQLLRNRHVLARNQHGRGERRLGTIKKLARDPPKALVVVGDFPSWPER